MLVLFFVRVVVGLWIMATTLMVLYSLSDSIFNHNKNWKRNLSRRLYVSLTWPLMIFSPLGRKQIFNILKGII